MGLFGKKSTRGRSAYYDAKATKVVEFDDQPGFVSIEVDDLDPVETVEPVESHIPRPMISVYPDKAGKWRWRLRLGNNKNFAASGESFSRKGSATRAANRLSELIPGSVVVEEAPKPVKAAKKAAKKAT